MTKTNGTKTTVIAGEEMEIGVQILISIGDMRRKQYIPMTNEGVAIVIQTHEFNRQWDQIVGIMAIDHTAMNKTMAGACTLTRVNIMMMEVLQMEGGE